MDAILKYLPSIRVPTPNSRVYKDECCYSFHNTESDGGILVDMNSFLAFSPKYAMLNFKKTGHAIYLNIMQKRIAKEQPVKDPSQSATVLGVGVQGGFNSDNEPEYEPHFTYSIVLLPSGEKFPYPDKNLPMLLSQSADAIIAADSAAKKEEIKAWVASEELFESQYARTLVQEKNGIKLPSSGWKCDVCGGDATTNLWLNLSSGAVLCGRRNFDGTGGKGHALEHYQQHPDRPLAVKLGTITGEGHADVWSYPEDTMVIDPLLDQHLAHWGLDIKQLKKTDKSVAELEVELQHTFDWSKATESGKALVTKYGPGFTGMENLGNSCYMASVMQVLFQVPAFQERYALSAEDFFQQPCEDPTKDFHIQMAKLGHGLLSGDYSKPPPAETEKPIPGQPLETPPPSSVKPSMFKSLIGTQKAEFATNKQQDAAEFLIFLLDLIQRREHAKKENKDPSKVFSFRLIERLECSQSHQVRYSTAASTGLALPIPLDLSQNADEVEEYEALELSKSQEQKDLERSTNSAPPPIRHKIKLEDCLGRYFETEHIDGWYSPAIKGNTTALQTKRFGDFPEYLALVVNRFTFVPGKGPAKIEAFINAPDELDLEAFRGQWQQPNETSLPSDSPPPPQIDEATVQAIMGMGFPRVRAERAVYNNPGKAAEVVIDWLFSHMDDPSLDEPLPSSSPSTSAPVEINEEALAMLMSMGFLGPQCRKALQECNNDLERAAEWLFSHADEMDLSASSVEKVEVQGDGVPSFPFSPSRYRLFAFITHMGSSTGSGHYVAHIAVNGKWYIYNDHKVAESQEPPREMAYIYFYRRL